MINFNLRRYNKEVELWEPAAAAPEGTEGQSLGGAGVAGGTGRRSRSRRHGQDKGAVKPTLLGALLRARSGMSNEKFAAAAAAAEQALASVPVGPVVEYG
jgi:hypothetical protein